MSANTVKIYFSPTGNTKKSVAAMADAIGGKALDFDVTVDTDPNQYVLNAEDFAIFGAPVYGGRIPMITVERLRRFKGNNTPCIVVVTYGNRHYDDALLELGDLARTQGFVVKGGAALIGRHTFGDIQASRPDADDLAADRTFAKQAAANPNRTVHISGNTPYQKGGDGGGFRPLTSDACTACGLCAISCPAQAIGPDFKTIGDECISCFRCIRICPVGAKNMETEQYTTWAAEFSRRLKDRRENEYFL